MKLSRIDRIQRTFTVADLFPELDPASVTSVSFALLAPRSESPTSATVWSSAYTVSGGDVTVLFVGPDADSTGAVAVDATADLWAKASGSFGETEAVKIPDRITVAGSSGTIAPVGPPPQVLTVQGRTGAVVLTATDVGADAAGAAVAAQSAAATDATTKVNAATTASALDAATATNVASGAATSAALKAAYAPLGGLPVLAAAYGVSAANTDNTAALNAAFAAAISGTVILPPGVLRHTGALTADGCNIFGSGVSTTVLNCTAQLGGTTPALTWNNTGGQTRKLANFEMKGPTAPSLGTKTANTWGLLLNNSVFLDQIKAQQFDAGIILNSSSGHIYGWGLNTTNCYYGMYWAKNNSDFHFVDCLFTGNKYASIATPADVGIASARFDRCHFGYGPYGVYQEAAPANQGSNKIFLQEVTFDNSRFEQIGNSAIWSDAQDDASNYSQFADVLIVNPGFSWADGICGGAPWATLTTQPASYAIKLGTIVRNIRIIDGPAPFLTGLTTPTIASSAATAGLYYANRAIHNAWTRVYANGGASTDLTIGSGTQNYYFGNFEMPADKSAGITLPRFTATKAGTAAGYIGRHDGGQPANGTYNAGDWSTDFTTPGIWMTSAGGVNPAWTNLLQIVSTASVPPVQYVAGQYYGIAGPRTTSATNANGTLTWFPFRCDSAHTFTGIACEVTSLGSTGAVVRLGVYGNNAGKPGALVSDCGTIAADTGGTGRKAITGLSLALTPGWYWLAAVVQGAPTTVPTMRVVGATVLEGAPIAAGVQSGGGWNESTSVTGALANAASPGVNGNTIAVALLA